MKKIVVSACVLVALLILQDYLSPGSKAYAQSFTNKVYASSDVNFPNPERGLYHHTEVHSGNYSNLNKTQLTGYLEDGISLILRVFYLENFVDGDISNDYLTKMRQDFAVARSAGVKVIVRFAYTTRTSSPFRDARPEKVLAHIAQLKPVLRDNSDVIATVQAGFIGAWGEWYYTDHFSQFIGSNNETNWADRQAVVDALLDAMPLTRTVQVRTPVYKRKFAGQAALTEVEAFDGSKKARLGHHNDCFLASSTDVGTYINIEEEKNYIEQETYYVPIGGETCGVSVPRSECPNATAEMERLHWSYLNIDYHPQVLSGFETGGCMLDVKTKLGYRYRLTEGSLQQTGTPGGIFEIELSIVNDGWANAYNPRSVEIVLRNSTGKEYKFLTTQDPRKWTLSGTVTINETIGLPEDMEEGVYSILINLPDPELSLSENPSFSIRLANEDTWEVQTGYNSLGGSIDIAESHSHPDYMGAEFFKLQGELDPSLTPNPLFASSASNQVLLYWGIEPGDAHRVIQREEDGEFQTLAIVPGTQFDFIDRDVIANTTYKYRYFFKQDNLISDLSSEIQINTKISDPPYYEFAADNSKGEWDVVPPLATLYLSTPSETYTVRSFGDGINMNFLIEGAHAGYDIYLDTDNSTTTGNNESAWETNGFDYLVRDGSLFGADDGSWNFIDDVTFQVSSGFREINVPFSLLTNLGQNIIINIAVIATLENDEKLYLPFEGQKAAVYTRALPAPIPSAFNVTSSEAFPESRAVIEWHDQCDNCKGFVIERSLEANNNFEALASGLTDNIYLDNGLVLNTTYYYRMFSYNDTGKSQYTDVKSVTTTNLVSGVGDEPGLQLEAFPNPVSQVLHIRSSKSVFNYPQITLMDALGRAVDLENVNETSHEITVEVGSLSSGIYLLKVRQGDEFYSLRILKI